MWVSRQDSLSGLREVQERDLAGNPSLHLPVPLSTVSTQEDLSPLQVALCTCLELT